MFVLVVGSLEHDKTPEEGITRELKGETSLDACSISLIGVYEFVRKNELIITYHVVTDGETALSEELVEYRLKPSEKIRPWTVGTDYAVADFLTARRLPASHINICTGEPTEPSPHQWQPTRLVIIPE